MVTNMRGSLLLWLGAMRRQWLMLIFMIAPAIGLGLVAMIFGLPLDLRLLAGVMTVLAGGLILILLRGEVRFIRSRKA